MARLDAIVNQISENSIKFCISVLLKCLRNEFDTFTEIPQPSKVHAFIHFHFTEQVYKLLNINLTLGVAQLPASLEKSRGNGSSQ